MNDTPKPRRPGVRCTTSALGCTSCTRGVQENTAIGLVVYISLAKKMSIADFDDWRDTIEVDLHNTFHNLVGGTMRTFDSANAPEFFLHHNFVDKMWADWQSKSVAHKQHGFAYVDYL